MTQGTLLSWLIAKFHSSAKSLAKLRAFLNAAAKRQPQGDGIRPIEHEPFKIIRPAQQVRYARLCPFCRKERGKIRKLRATSFQGILPKEWSDRPEAGKAIRKRSGRGMGGKS